MKILLDENLPHDLRHSLSMHETFTVAYMGWVGVENLTNLPVAVIILTAKSNAMDDLTPMIPKLLEAVDNLAPKTLVRIT